MIVADTNVVSEFMKEQPDANVMSWARTIEPAGLTVSVVTVEEIERGLRQLPDRRKRRDLDQRWQRLLSGFADIVAIYDVPAAQATAEVLIEARANGRPMSHADAQIAGTCLAGGHTLVTRNVNDFAGVQGLRVVNPFEPASTP